MCGFRLTTSPINNNTSDICAWKPWSDSLGNCSSPEPLTATQPLYIRPNQRYKSIHWTMTMTIKSCTPAIQFPHASWAYLMLGSHSLWFLFLDYLQWFVCMLYDAVEWAIYLALLGPVLTAGANAVLSGGARLQRHTIMSMLARVSASTSIATSFLLCFLSIGRTH